MRLIITSRARADKCKTLKYIPEAKLPITALAVYEDEVAAYARLHPVIIAVPTELKAFGLSAKRQWLLENVEDELMVLMDDDFRFLKKIDSTHLREAPPDEIVKMFDMLEEWMVKDKLVHVSIAPRLGANRLDVEFQEACRMMHLLAYNREVLISEGCRFDRVRYMSDFDMTLQLLRKGYRNRVSFKYATDPSSSNATGGCSEYRSKEGLAEAANKLKSLHPYYVDVVQRETESAWRDWGSRTDVTVQWKKAYNAGAAVYGYR